MNRVVSEPSTRRQDDVKGITQTRGFYPHRVDERRGDHRDPGGHRHSQLPAVSVEVTPVGRQGESECDQDLNDRLSGRKILLSGYSHDGCAWCCTRSKRQDSSCRLAKYRPGRCVCCHGLSCWSSFLRRSSWWCCGAHRNLH